MRPINDDFEYHASVAQHPWRVDSRHRADDERSPRYTSISSIITPEQLNMCA